jgi:hypothetical protein
MSGRNIIAVITARAACVLNALKINLCKGKCCAYAQVIKQYAMKAYGGVDT